MILIQRGQELNVMKSAMQEIYEGRRVTKDTAIKTSPGKIDIRKIDRIKLA